jgi:tetratricopeptide (TPR) repeat protein
LTIAGKSPGVEFPELATMISHLADLKTKQAKYDEGATLAFKAVAMDRRLRGAEHPMTGWTLVVEGKALRGQRKLTESEAAFREALRIFRKYYSFGDKNVDQVMTQLRLVLEDKADSAAIEALDREDLCQ